MNMKKNPLSLQLDLTPEDFLPASEDEKESLVIMRESVSFWKDGFRRLKKNKVAMVCIFVIAVIMIFAFIVPSFYPYTYKDQIIGANNLSPMTYSVDEQARIAAGEKVFPHIMGTDKMGRDYAIRVMMGTRISLLDHPDHRFNLRVCRGLCRWMGGPDYDAACRHHIYDTGCSADCAPVLCSEGTAGSSFFHTGIWMG